MLSDMPHFIEPVIRLSCSGKVELFEFARKVVLGLVEHAIAVFQNPP